ncbi:MAG: FAD-dependent oxidoreductase [Chloracidobacterium sp.]|uniref:FAD-dependent oxidoreductase n=1 Tax=Chloracidobacterium validum TaxID=2821543 RepID=A0ABX8BFX1_9BACT|nr:FAD-dependent oxidoreductase [Chloracidobacterium validum]QUW04574.1 FAD-dependent oxidoreductase [Chloracidobacterium validum]
MTERFDIVIIGAGSGGLTAAGFAAQLGAKVALVEKHRIGGDCTWTGCVPSKALLKAAKIAHEVRQASQYGIVAEPPRTDMARVRAYVQGVIGSVYAHEAPEELQRNGIEVILAPGRFLDAQTLAAGDRVLTAKYFLICTGARPSPPDLRGLDAVPFLTYETIFDLDELPEQMIVVGGGPIGCELAQAFQRLGSQVTLVAARLLPKEEPEVDQTLRTVFGQEGMRFVAGRARTVARQNGLIRVESEAGVAEGDVLFIAAGRRPSVAGLDLDKAGVQADAHGIPVDTNLRTNVKHIFAAGDVLGGHQFTHFAGWQAFLAARNALLLGSTSGFTDIVPWVTFTDPEVAHVGLTEAAARAKHGDAIKVNRWAMDRTDRAVCDNDTAGFLKVLSRGDGTLLGATMVAPRAGEAITEFTLALNHRLKVTDVANAIHAYPTYSTAAQQLAAGVAVENFLTGTAGKVIQSLSKIMR